LLLQEGSVAQFVVRHLENDVKEKLKRRAKRHGRSMEDEVRHILRDAAKNERRPARRLGSRIAARFKKAGVAADFAELRGQRPRPADFEE
jgi:plasmid stability protein